MRNLLFLLLLFLTACGDVIVDRVPAKIRIIAVDISPDSVEFNVAWSRVTGASAYDFTFRSMPRIKQLEMARVITDTSFGVRVHKNDIPYSQITVYATAIASLSDVLTGWIPAYDKPPPPPVLVVMDTIVIN